MSDILELNHKGAVPKDIDGTDVEITRLRADLAAANTRMSKLDFERTAAELERDALRADLAAVTAERDRMRQSVNSMIVMLEMTCDMLERPTYHSLEVGFRHNPLSQKEIIQRLTETCSFVRADLLKTIDEARAALEGVKEPASPKAETEFFVLDEFAPLPEPASPWRDIETAPKDGTPVEGSELYRYLPYKPEGRRQMKADGRWQRWNGYGWENSEPPQRWKPLPEPASHKGPDEHLNLRNAECLPSTAAIMKPEPPKGNKNGIQ